MYQKLIFIALLLVFSVKTSSQNTNNFTIEKNDSVFERVYEIDEITVEQKKEQNKLTGISSGRITLHTEGIKSLPALLGTTDLLKILELTPGVQTSGEGKSNLYIRGGDPGQTLLLYNNIPVYTPGHALNIFPMFNADHMESIDLIKGGVNAQFGNFISGAIIADTKQTVPDKTTVRGNVGLISSQAAADLKMNDNWGAYISGRITYLNLFLRPLTNFANKSSSTNMILDMSYDFYDVNATIIGKLSENNKLIIDFSGGNDKLDIQERQIDIHGNLKWDNYLASAKLFSDLKKDIKLEQQLSYSRFNNKLTATLSDYSVNLRSLISSVDYNSILKYKLFSLPIKSGISYTYYTLSPQQNNIVNLEMEIPNTSFGTNEAQNFAAFTSLRINPTAKLYIEPGIRYHIFHSKLIKYDTRKTFHHVDFRLWSKYEFSSENLIRATFSHNTQYIYKLFPSSNGLPTDFWIGASSETLPQYANEYSAGYYHSFLNGSLELSSDVYFRTMNNVVEYNQNFLESEHKVFTEYLKTGKGRAYGIEFMLKKNYGKFTGWLSYTLGKSERFFDDINNGKSFPASHDRTHDLSIVGSYKFNEKFDVSCVQVFATGNAFTVPSSWYFINNVPVKEYGEYNGARMTNYMRTDISMNYWFKKDNGINLSIYNITAHRNPLYINMSVEETEEKTVIIKMKKRLLYTIMPSISWKFKF